LCVIADQASQKLVQLLLWCFIGGSPHHTHTHTHTHTHKYTHARAAEYDRRNWFHWNKRRFLLYSSLEESKLCVGGL